MTKQQRDVWHFHAKFDVPMSSRPEFRDRILALDLVMEEVDELREAIVMGDMVETADAIVDALYVLNGMACRFGIDLAPLWDEVHRTNMAKDGGGKRADQKILKPDGWKPPEIARLLKEQGWDG